MGRAGLAAHFGYPLITERETECHLGRDGRKRATTGPGRTKKSDDRAGTDEKERCPGWDEQKSASRLEKLGGA